MPPLRPQPRFPENDTSAFWDATKRRESDGVSRPASHELPIDGHRRSVAAQSDQSSIHTAIAKKIAASPISMPNSGKMKRSHFS